MSTAADVCGVGYDDVSLTPTAGRTRKVGYPLSLMIIIIIIIVVIILFLPLRNKLIAAGKH